MNLEDLRVSLQNFMPTWCEIEKDDDGQIVTDAVLAVYAALGELVDMDE